MNEQEKKWREEFGQWRKDIGRVDKFEQDLQRLDWEFHIFLVAKRQDAERLAVLESQRDVSMAHHAGDYAKMYKEIAELRAKLEAVSKDRDELAGRLQDCEINYGMLDIEKSELAAQVEVIKYALRIRGHDCAYDNACGEPVLCEVCEALSLPPSDVLREVKAQVLECVAAELNSSPVPECKRYAVDFRAGAAEIRKGE